MSFFTTPQQARESSRNIGNNIFDAVNKQRQKDEIGSILKEAQDSKDPNAYQKSIGQILASGVDPQFKQNALQAYAIIGKQQEFESQQLKQKRERQALIDANVNPDLPLALQQAQFKQNQEDAKSPEAKLSIPDRTKVSNLKAAIPVVQRMEEILKKHPSAIGVIAGRVNILPKALKAQQEYDNLSKFLLPLSFNVPIRNQNEFNVALGVLGDSKSTVSANEGAIKSIKRIINSSLGSFGVQGGFQQGQQALDFDNTGQPQQGQQQQGIDQESVNKLFE
jgi:hypothetical protein